MESPPQIHSLWWERGKEDWSPKENMDSVSRRLDHEPWRGEGEVAHWITILTCLKWKQRGEVTGGRSHSDPRVADFQTSFRQHYRQQLTHVAPAVWELFTLPGNSPEKLPWILKNLSDSRSFPLAIPILEVNTSSDMRKVRPGTKRSLKLSMGTASLHLEEPELGFECRLVCPFFSNQRWLKQPNSIFFAFESLL